MPKFFVNQENIQDKKVIIIGEDVNHIKNVLRKNIGDKLEICNIKNSQNYLCKIEEVEKQKILCSIIEKTVSNQEPKTYVHIYQGLPKSDKMEFIIQKSVELGVAEITPINMSRCVVKLNQKEEEKKVQRWQKISEVAAKQSERNIIPKINIISNINKIVEQFENYDIILLAYENEKNNKLKDQIKLLKENMEFKKEYNLKIAVIIGPEGGIAPEEMEILTRNGAKSITLGNRTLRTETVALNILSIIMYELE